MIQRRAIDLNSLKNKELQENIRAKKRLNLKNEQCVKNECVLFYSTAQAREGNVFRDHICMYVNFFAFS